MFITAYGSTVVWFLNTHLRELLIEYWEIVLIYLGSFGVGGLIFTRVIRGNEETKHYYRVTAKWYVLFNFEALIFNFC